MVQLPHISSVQERHSVRFHVYSITPESHPNTLSYVGTLHEINSSESTVSLENVVSHGTEGRRGGGAEEISPSDQIYEYIVFRGSDVKDLRIEQTPKKETLPAGVPDDPAIVGVSFFCPQFLCKRSHDEISRM